MNKHQSETDLLDTNDQPKSGLNVINKYDELRKKIEELCDKHSNDFELGNAIRNLISKLNT